MTQFSDPTHWWGLPVDEKLLNKNTAAALSTHYDLMPFLEGEALAGIQVPTNLPLCRSDVIPGSTEVRKRYLPVSVAALQQVKSLSFHVVPSSASSGE